MEEAEHSTAEHGKRRRGSYVQYTSPYHLYREAEDSRCSAKVGGKRRKERGRHEEVDRIPYGSTAQHALTRKKKKRSDNYAVHYFPRLQGKGRDVASFPTAHHPAMKRCSQVNIRRPVRLGF